MEILAPEYADLKQKATNLKSNYTKAKPFPHIYFDDFFNADFLKKVLNEFPDLDKQEDQIFYSNPNEEKHASKGTEQFKENTTKLVEFLNSQPFLDFLQELTGIKEKLISDPDFEGGGFHQIKPGGFLKIHVDFHKHRKMGLDRRLNLLIYLNEDWKEEYGGHFELWEKDMSACAVKIAPLFNRLAMFSTTGTSWHGHPDPLTCPPDRSRKSLALYYYSDGRPEEELDKSQKGRVTTTFALREGMDSADMRRYNTIVNLANKILPNWLIKVLKSFRNK